MQDVVIIGAGPGGLTAACYLARFRRRAVVIDGQESRARWIPESHNTPGFPQGVGGTEFLARLRAQAVRYGAEIRTGQVRSLRQTDQGFEIHCDTIIERSRFVLLATGVRDTLPPLANAEAAVVRALVRICPICDAFEAIDKNIAVVGTGKHAAREAEFLATYSDRVTLIHVGDEAELPAARASATRVRVISARVEELSIQDGSIILTPPIGPSSTFDVLYSALGCSPQHQLATAFDAARDENGALLVNSHQETSIPRLYAAGDVVRGLNQIVVAAAEAAVAATDIHNRLRDSTADATHRAMA